MNASHVAGGGLGGLVGIILAALGTRIGLHLTDVDAAVIGSAALGAGVGVGHALSEYGLLGIGSIILHGRRKPVPIIPARPAVPPAPVPPIPPVA